MSASRRVGVIACGALAVHVRAIARRRGWPVDLHPVPALRAAAQEAVIGLPLEGRRGR